MKLITLRVTHESKSVTSGVSKFRVISINGESAGDSGASNFALQLLALRWQIRNETPLDWTGAKWAVLPKEVFRKDVSTKDHKKWVKALGRSLVALCEDHAKKESHSHLLAKPPAGLEVRIADVFHPQIYRNSMTNGEFRLSVSSEPLGLNPITAFQFDVDGAVLSEHDEARLLVLATCQERPELSALDDAALLKMLRDKSVFNEPWTQSVASVLERLSGQQGKTPATSMFDWEKATLLDETTSELVDGFLNSFRPDRPPLTSPWTGSQEDVAMLRKWSAECKVAKADRLRSEVLALMAAVLEHRRSSGKPLETTKEIESQAEALCKQVSTRPHRIRELAKHILHCCMRGWFVPELDLVTAPHTHRGGGHVWSLMVTRTQSTPGPNAGHGYLFPSWACALMKKPHGLEDTTEAEALIPDGMVYRWELIAETRQFERLIEKDDQEIAIQLSTALLTTVKKLNEKIQEPNKRELPMTQKTDNDEAEPQTVAPDSFVFAVGDFVEDYFERFSEQAELERIFAHTEDNNFLIHAAVTKLGGIGKTQLARWYAHKEVKEKHDAGKKHPFRGGAAEINLRAHNFNPDSTKDGVTTGSKELDPMSATRELLTMFGAEEASLDKFETWEKLNEHYHSYFSDKNALLILDNAKDYEQVKDLLPRPGSTTRAIVTAREEIEGLTPVTLHAWSRKEVHEYLSKERNGRRPWVELSRWCDDEPAQNDLLERIYLLSQGLPLVLHMLSAFTIATESAGRRTVFELLEHRLKELEADGEACNPTAAIGAMIDLSLRLLDRDKQRQFLNLSIFRVHFDAAAASTLNGGNTLSTQRMREELHLFYRLGLLIKESVLLFSDEQRRQVKVTNYRMHDLVRKDASQKLVSLVGHKEIAELERKYVVHYLGAQAFQNELILANPHTTRDNYRSRFLPFDVGAAWFDREEQNFDIAFALCDKRRMKNGPSRNELLSLTAGVATRACDLLMSVEKRITRVGEGRDAAKRLASTAKTNMAERVFETHIAMHTNSLGLAYRHKGNRPEARNLFTEAIKRSEELEWDEGLTCAMGNRGNIHQEDASDSSGKDKAAHLSEALKCHRAAMKISERINAKLSEGQDNGNAAICLMDQWDQGEWKNDKLFDDAIKHYDKRLDIAAVIGDERGLGNGQGNAATAKLLKYLKSDPPDVEAREEALKDYQDAFEHHEKARNPRGMAACIGNLGRAKLILACLDGHGANKLMEDAKEHIEKSYAIFTKVGDLLGQRMALSHRRAWYLANDQPRKAQADEAEIQRCESLLDVKAQSSGIKPLKLLPKGNEQALGRHLADKYGKLCHIDLSDQELREAYGAAREVANAKDICEEFLKLEIES